MLEPLLSPTFLFRFASPMAHRKTLWTKTGSQLKPENRLASFGELEGQHQFAQVYGAWNAGGLVFSIEVSGKTQSLWCRESRPEESDGLHLWIDTRDTHSIHRASRFCHRFVVLPAGGEPGGANPMAAMVGINRAKQSPSPPASGAMKTASSLTTSGYKLAIYLPAHVLTGYDPEEHPRLGFNYAITDRELGVQTFSIGQQFPIEEDPSLWGTLELKKPG